MAKPIFISRIPYTLTDDEYQKCKDILKEQLQKEYHLIFISQDISDFQFECFNSENVDDIEIEDLLKKVDERRAKRNIS